MQLKKDHRDKAQHITANYMESVEKIYINHINIKKYLFRIENSDNFLLSEDARNKLYSDDEYVNYNVIQLVDINYKPISKYMIYTRHELIEHFRNLINDKPVNFILDLGKFLNTGEFEEAVRTCVSKYFVQYLEDSRSIRNRFKAEHKECIAFMLTVIGCMISITLLFLYCCYKTLGF